MGSSWPDSAPCAPNQRGLARTPIRAAFAYVPLAGPYAGCPESRSYPPHHTNGCVRSIRKIAGMGRVLGMLSTASAGSKELMRPSSAPRQPGRSGHWG
jgi:hypothetical protein